MTVRRRFVGGFAVHSLGNAAVSVALVPELGGRIVSLRDRATGREWLDGWVPAARRRLWRPADPADFATGPGAGIDECLPTVLPCRLGALELPDHGDLWNAAADFEVADGALVCRWGPASLPLAFERRLTLSGSDVWLDYRLENLAAAATPFLWCWHPLFSWKPGDRIHCPAAGDTCLTGDGARHPWPEFPPGCDLSRATFAAGATPAAKVFLGPLAAGAVEIHARGGAALALEWPARHFPYAGIWITRGFWKGLHHWAVEPTNAPVDRLSDIAPAAPLTLLEPGEVRRWRVAIRLGAAD